MTLRQNITIGPLTIFSFYLTEILPQICWKFTYDLQGENKFQIGEEILS